MINCFVTGVQCRIEEAFVLNRREAHELLDLLKDRIASLRRVIDQLSPMDDRVFDEARSPSRIAACAPKKHRLVCKTIADALAPGFPEIKLFMEWPQYHKQVRQILRQEAKGRLLFGELIEGLSNNALRKAEKLSIGVLQLLDSQHQLPSSTRKAIAVGTCVIHRGLSAAEVVKMIRTAASENGDPVQLGIPLFHLNTLRDYMGLAKVKHQPEQPA